MAKEDSHKGSVSDLDLVRVREKCSLRLPPCEHTMKTTSVCKPGRNLTGWHLDFGLPYTKTVKKKSLMLETATATFCQSIPPNANTVEILMSKDVQRYFLRVKRELRSKDSQVQ